LLAALAIQKHHREKDMSEETKSEEIKQAEPEYLLAEFLESHPPNQSVRIKNLAKKDHIGYWADILNTPQLQLHCSNNSCNGSRFFRFDSKKAP
jgi:hypothetical protein